MAVYRYRLFTLSFICHYHCCLNLLFFTATLSLYICLSFNWSLVSSPISWLLVTEWGNNISTSSLPCFSVFLLQNMFQDVSRYSGFVPQECFAFQSISSHNSIFFYTIFSLLSLIYYFPLQSIILSQVFDPSVLIYPFSTFSSRIFVSSECLILLHIFLKLVKRLLTVGLLYLSVMLLPC